VAKRALERKLGRTQIARAEGDRKPARSAQNALGVGSMLFFRWKGPAVEVEELGPAEPDAIDAESSRRSDFVGKANISQELDFDAILRAKGATNCALALLGQIGPASALVLPLTTTGGVRAHHDRAAIAIHDDVVANRDLLRDSRARRPPLEDRVIAP
jgi:hypothetical protein